MNYSKYLKDNLNIDINDAQLIEQALTHPSYANEIKMVNNHYERLEFIGDAILQFLVSDYIYKTYPEVDEGIMTVLRAKAVREASLAEYATEYDLSAYIKVGRGERKSGGSNKKSVLANVFEAVLGAIYLSNNIEDANKFLKIVYQYINDNKFDDLEDYKTKLQEYVQADTKRTVTYELVKATGSANNPNFEFKVVMDDLILGQGSGDSKKKAQQNAAKDALLKLANNA